MDRLDWDGPAVKWWQILLMVVPALAFGVLLSFPIVWDALRILGLVE